MIDRTVRVEREFTALHRAKAKKGFFVKSGGLSA
jgi:hypothetical protein